MSETPLIVWGSIYSKLTYEDRGIDAKFYVVEGNYGSLFGKDSAKRINLILVGPENPFPLNTLSTPNTAGGIVSKYPSVFSGVVKLKTFRSRFILIPQ